ncbi:MAG: thioredoxin domain-containing protein [Lysobacterales bacterium]
MMNRLHNESSLYLRQHAANPVHWQPWDQRALDEARSRGVPILLSIGYSACHWCHVMAHESFEHAPTADLMNRLFVNIKVDREERPDLDRVYQLSHQLLTGRGGGWPLTVFLDPDGQVPFFAGTYFPLERRYGMPAFREVLQAVHQWYSEKGDEVADQNRKLTAALDRIQAPEPGAADAPGPEQAAALLRRAADQVESRLDRASGGYGGAPKFPQAPLLQAVAWLGGTDHPQLEDGLVFSLERMASSGLRDHLDGGFFRYCVDATWTIPHFEKMLYDNAQLLPLYAEAASRSGNPLLREAAEGIAGWLVDEMRQAGGAYAASIDADADGEEGGFHVWTPEQVSALLEGRALQVFTSAYGLDRPANFENRAWHLVRHRTDAELARSFSMDEPTIREELAGAREMLRRARSDRIHPTLDDKQLGSWNALLAAGFVRAGRALERQDWLDRADEILAFVRRELWSAGQLHAVYNRGEARLAAYLDDYAWLLDALLERLQARWSAEWLGFAIEIADAMLERFEDEAHGGFYFSDAAVEVPVTRSMVWQDDATPCGNAAAARALFRLGRLLGEPRFERAASRCVARSASVLEQSTLALASMLPALSEAADPPLHLVISGGRPEDRRKFRQWVDARYRLDCYALDPNDDALPGVLAEYRSADCVTAWLCRGTHCMPPVSTREDLERLLQQ